jgi:hypothetical protein
MIVKNEANIIASTLENLCHYIEFDYWVIVDTGSTDNTKQIISDFFKDKNIKGELHETEWKNFGFNRSDALSKAFNKTDYLLIFDADDRIVGEFVLPKELNLDGYHLKFGDNFSYVRLLLVNNALHWKFMGVLHEYIICTNENYSCKYENIEGNYHLISGKSGARSNNPNKYRDDALILETAYDEAQKNKDDIMVRYSFYCAQSYKDAGNHERSIEWYKKRISHGGWNQEVYYSYITIGQLYAKMNNIESAFYYWTLSFDADPERCEGIYYIIKHCREKANFQLALHYYKWIEKNKTRNLIGKLFVTENVYKYLLDYEFTIIACYVGEHKNAIPSFHTLFKYANALSSSLKENIVSNLQFYINFIDSENLSFFYDYLAFVKQIYLETGGLKKHIDDITDKMKDKFAPRSKPERKFNILNLILFSNENCFYREYYLKIVELQKEYTKSYKSNNNNITFYFYCYKEDLQEEYIIEDDVIYIKGAETYVPGILEKTIKAFEITKNMEYDFLLRSNISTVIDYSKLDDILYKIPDDVIYAGGSCRLLTWLDPDYGIHKVYNIPFILGTSIILKREGVHKLINNKNVLSETIIDDVAFGLFFNHFGDKPYGFDSYYRYNLSCVTNDVIFYRNRISYEKNKVDKSIEIANMTNIIKQIMKRECNNIIVNEKIENLHSKLIINHGAFNQSTNQSNESNNEIIYNKNKIESDYETNNSMLQYGQLSNTDKVTHHEYHKYYEPVLKPYYNSHGSIVEIGLGTGQSLPMWQNLFKHAHIYGVDKEYENSGNDRYTIYKGDQSNVNDLNDLRKSLTDKNVFFINDDGSHIPEHQLLTFNTLFPILKEGGIYIIEDIETSYWTKGECYNYKTRYGYKHPDSIVEIFKDASDIMNREFIVDKTNLSKKILHYDYIESVTFARNCIIIKKNYNANREYRFKIFT